MKFILSGFIAGAVAGLIFFQGTPASELKAFSYSDIASLQYAQVAEKSSGSFRIPVVRDGKARLVDQTGSVSAVVDLEGSLASFSGNGSMLVRYGKVGTEIGMWNSSGDRFWKKKSRETPLLSHEGKLVFLINGDHSSIRILDRDGNETGAGRVSGRLCTVVGFSFPGNYGSCGFADGTYYFFGEKGDVLNSGRVPSGTVKSIAVCSTFGAVHYGTAAEDSVRIINFKENSFSEIRLRHVHHVKTAMHISEKGRLLFLDSSRLLLADSDGDIAAELQIPEKRPGHSSISAGKGFYSVTYTKKTGEAFFLILDREGNPFFTREFAGESFLDSASEGNSILLRGSDSLFAYNFYPSEE